MAAGCRLPIVKWLVAHGAKLDAVDNVYTLQLFFQPI